MAYFEYFPEAFIQLQIEILEYQHVLQTILDAEYETLRDRDPELQFAKILARIARYCNINLDDTYSPKDLEKLADMCTERLKRNRTSLVVTADKDGKVVERGGGGFSGLVDENGNPIIS